MGWFDLIGGVNMESNEDLQSLIERACNLQERVNEEINNSVSFCNYCSEHGWFCKIAETPFEERERLIAFRDSLKEVEDMLIHIQKMMAWQLISRQAALNQVEQSRIMLMEKVSKYEGQPLSVIKELNASFGNGKSAFDWNYEKRKTNSSLLCCIKFLCNPDRWQRAIGAAAKLIAISISVSSTVYFCRTRQQHCSLSESMRTIPNSHIDVFKGRG